MVDLPNGIVTFLFTDIQGSTRLWEQFPEEMRQSLRRHDDLIAESITESGGIIVKPRGEGDSCFIVFSLATEAVEAAVNLQRILLKELWNPNTIIRTRMALHTGEADLRDGDYYGTVVNRCARLRSIGHGGQILLSQATYELVRDALPPGITLQSMGVHRLRDLQRPEQVFQLNHPDLPSKFPPLRSLNAIPNNLPQQLTSFVGRDREIKEVMRLLKTTRLLTLTGTGGCGKTRLALQVAAEVLEQYPDGVWFIDLAPINDPNLIPQTVAQVLDVKEEGVPLAETLLNCLRYKTVLLVFDNYEHLIVARDLLSKLLQHTLPTLRVLTTSREVLGITGELVWRVPSLSIPSQHQLPSLESLTQYEAVQLFIDRAILARPTFTVTNQNAPDVAQICQRLDGIPLAIELAAARVRVMSVEQINQRLNERFKLLTGGSRTLLPRQQTLRALIDWGYNLLSEAEQRLLRRLSVFGGGWTLEAAEVICVAEGIEQTEILDLLSALVNKSLVVLEEQETDEVRYRFLETLRQYGQEKLIAAGEAPLFEQRYRSYFLELVEAIGCQQTNLAKLEAELNNLRAVLASYETRETEVQEQLRLVLGLSSFWAFCGHWAEGRQWLEKVLSKDHTYPTATLATLMSRLGDLAIRQGDYRAARSLYEDSLNLHRQLNATTEMANDLFNLGNVALCQSEYVLARSLYEESLQIQQRSADQTGLPRLLFTLGVTHENQGNYEVAQTFYQESIEIGQKLGDRFWMAYALSGFGSIAEKLGNYELAQSYYRDSFSIRRQLGDKQGIAYSRNGFGSIAEKLGDYARAQLLHQDSLQIQRELGDKMGISYSLRFLGSLAERNHDYEQAQSLYKESLQICRELKDQLGAIFAFEGLARVLTAQKLVAPAIKLLGVTDALRKTLGSPVTPVERDRHQQMVQTLKSSTDENTFSAMFAQGQTIELEAAIDAALKIEFHPG